MRFNTILCAVAAGSLLFGAQAAPVKDGGKVDMHRLMSRTYPKNTTSLASQREDVINKTMAKMATRSGQYPDEGYQPTMSLGPVSNYGEMLGPDGKMWYFTEHLKMKEIPHYSATEWYTEYVLTEYEYKFYDSKFNLIGSIRDKMRYADNEVRVPGPAGGISLLGVATRKFFNDDNLTEIAVGIAINTTTPGVNHYRTMVYSIGGSKETVDITYQDGQDPVQVEVDKPVYQMNGFINDVVRAASGDQEQLYMSVVGGYGQARPIDWDLLMEGDETQGENYWYNLSHTGQSISTYTKVQGQEGLTKVFNWGVTYQQQQGDQEDDPFVISTEKDGRCYMICPYYKETFFNPYYTPYDEDMSMRANNVFCIDVYELTPTGSVLVKQTEIPFSKSNKQNVLATYMAVGRLRYAEDLNLTDPENPEYTISTSNLLNDDSVTGYCYYVYNGNGVKLRTLFENADSTLPLYQVPGQPDEQLFVYFDEDDGYVYNFVDMATGYNKNRTVKINYQLFTDPDSEDPEILSFNMDRAPAGEGYKYVFEIRTPVVDENDNDVMRIAWFNSDGSFDRIDEVNMGKSVYYAKSFMYGPLLQENVFKQTDEPIYMVLVKRGINTENSQSQEEFLLAERMGRGHVNGNNVLYLGPCDKGSLSNVAYLEGTEDEPANLMVTYIDSDERYSLDYYPLPLDAGHSGIADLQTEGDTLISLMGDVVSAPDAEIRIYNAKGMLMAKGHDTVSVAGLDGGLYIVTAGGRVAKFIK